MESDTLAQGEGVFSQVIVDRVSFSQGRVDFVLPPITEGQQGFVDLLAGTQGLAVGFI